MIAGVSCELFVKVSTLNNQATVQFLLSLLTFKHDPIDSSSHQGAQLEEDNKISNSIFILSYSVRYQHGRALQRFHVDLYLSGAILFLFFGKTEQSDCIKLSASTAVTEFCFAALPHGVPDGIEKSVRSHQINYDKVDFRRLEHT
jgi:hypothetical protein